MPTEPGPASVTDLEVRGNLPAALSGHYVHLVPDPVGGEVHAVALQAGRAVSYGSRRIETDDLALTSLVAFGSSLFALGDGAMAYEVAPTLDVIQRADLAGARRPLAAHATVDPSTGELHLLTFADPPSQLHVAVSRGCLTRTIRSIGDAPGMVRHLELTPDHVVLVTDGFVGFVERAGVGATTTWFEIDNEALSAAKASQSDRSELVFVADPNRNTSENGGWLVGFVDHDEPDKADFVVIDAGETERPLATVLLPRAMRNGGHGTWLSG